MNELENNDICSENTDFHRNYTKPYRRLIQLRDQLIESVNMLNLSVMNADGGDVTDWNEVGIDNGNRDVELALLAGENEEIHTVQQAIRRLEFGTYGTCVKCGNRITAERLEAIPYADRCIHCEIEYQS